LQVAVEVAAAEVISTNAEGTRPVDDLAGVTRAAEWTQPTRHVTTGAERHAIATHVRDPRWAEEFGTRIALLVRGGESSASLQLSPVELGPLDVSVTVRDSQASIHFGAAQAETRALIEATIPRLREMLETQGFQLANASVSTGSGQGHRQHVASGAQSPGESESPTTESGPMVSMNLLDVYV
jgi:flagellar hook-length control protein FliK